MRCLDTNSSCRCDGFVGSGALGVGRGAGWGWAGVICQVSQAITENISWPGRSQQLHHGDVQEAAQSDLLLECQHRTGG